MKIINSFIHNGKKIGGFKSWEQIGQKNPLAILDAQFSNGQTVSQVLQTFVVPNNEAADRVWEATSGIVNNFPLKEIDRIYRQAVESFRTSVD